MTDIGKLSRKEASAYFCVLLRSPFMLLYKTMRTIRGHLFIQVLYTHSLGIKMSVLAHKITKSFILTTTLFHTHKRTLQWFLQLWNRQEAPPQSLWQSDQWGENYYLKCVHTHKQGLVFHLVCFNLCKQKCLLFKTQETHTHTLQTAQPQASEPIHRK